MEMPNVVRVYRVDDTYFECIDGNRCVKVLIDQSEWTEEEKEVYSHMAEGSFAHVGRDFQGNIIRWAPLPRDEDFIPCEEEHPKPDTYPKPHKDPEDIS